MPDTSRLERVRTPDLGKFLEEVRALKVRLITLEIARLEGERQAAIESALKDASRKSKSPEEKEKLQLEAKKYAEAEFERSKQMLLAKFEKFDHTLTAVGHFFQSMGPVQEMEAKLAGEKEQIRKQLDELNVQKKVHAHEVEQLENDRALLKTGEENLAARIREVDQKLADLDVARRAEELDQVKADLDGKIKAYEAQMEEVVRAREEVNRDFDKMGEQRAQIDRDLERLNERQEKLDREKKNLVETVAREMAASLEAFVKDMLVEKKR